MHHLPVFIPVGFLVDECEICTGGQRVMCQQEKELAATVAGSKAKKLDLWQTRKEMER